MVAVSRNWSHAWLSW